MTNAQDKSASDHSLIEEGEEVAESSNDPKTNGNKSPDPELLNKLSPEARKVVEVGMMSMQRFGPMPNPIAEKLTPNHIDKILNIAEKDDERSYKDTGQSRKYTLIYILIFAALFIFTTIFLVGSDKELYKETMKLFSVFLGGLGSGFGIRSYMDKK